MGFPVVKLGPAAVLLILLAPDVRAARAEASSPAEKGLASASSVGTLPSGLAGDYLGEKLPGETPVPFAPAALGAISPWVEATAFSPDGTQVFLSVGAPDYSGAHLYFSRRIDNVWTPLAEPPFVAEFAYANEPVFSADGATLTFTGKNATGSIDLWTVRATGEGWSTPVALPAPVNSDGRDFRSSVMTDGTIYLGSNRSGMMQIYEAYEDASHARVARLLDPPVNTQAYEGDPCIAPDGHFLVFYSARDGRSSDLYVSFRDGKGAWGAPIRLGDAFNTLADEYGAHLSPDGRFLFFTRHSQQGNGIYWVDTSAIEKLRPE